MSSRLCKRGVVSWPCDPGCDRQNLSKRINDTDTPVIDFTRRVMSSRPDALSLAQVSPETPSPSTNPKCYTLPHHVFLSTLQPAVNARMHPWRCLVSATHMHPPVLTPTQRSQFRTAPLPPRPGLGPGTPGNRATELPWPRAAGSALSFPASQQYLAPGSPSTLPHTSNPTCTHHTETQNRQHPPSFLPEPCPISHAGYRALGSPARRPGAPGLCAVLPRLRRFRVGLCAQ